MPLGTLLANQPLQIFLHLPDPQFLVRSVICFCDTCKITPYLMQHLGSFPYIAFLQAELELGLGKYLEHFGEDLLVLFHALCMFHEVIYTGDDIL